MFQRPISPLHSVYRWAWFAACWFCLAPCVEADWKDDIGLTRLETALGDQMLTGNGIFISQVEAGSGDSNTYVPDPNSVHFNALLDPFGENPTFVNGSAGAHPNPNPSNHATNSVGQFYYGDDNGIARGANTIINYEAIDYLRNSLNCGVSGCATTTPDAPSFTDPSDGQQKNYRVVNHSWAGSLGSNTADQRALRKVDYLVDQYELTTAVGVENGNLSTPHPTLDSLLGHTYNGIAVGRSTGLHAIGPTSSLYGPDRTRPSVVSPRNTSSAATATVSGTATIMLDAVDGTLAERSEPMRAIIMAGATKEEFIDFIDPETSQPDPWDRTTTRPLDNILGAGELNVYNSYLITQGGQSAGSVNSPPTVGSYGWDYQTVSPGQTRKYEIEIPAGSTAQQLSIILTWNVDIDPSFNSQSLANLSMSLTDVTNPLSPVVIDQSDSAVDNIEHIYIGPDQSIDHLDPGTYLLEVSTPTLSQDYGLAWRTSTLFDVPSADFDEDGDVDGVDFLTWQRGVGALLGASHADGDADGDGDVDKVDLGILEADYGTSSLLANVVSVPEPGTIVLAVLSLPTLLFAPRWRASRSC